MPRRPDGPDPPAPSSPSWSGEHIEHALLTAFRAMPYTAIYAPRGNTLIAATPGLPDATFDILAFSGTVLGDRNEDRVLVLIWARSMASKGTVGGSIAEYCRRKGIDESTFHRRRKRICERIAQAKNRVDRELAPAAANGT